MMFGRLPRCARNDGFAVCFLFLLTLLVGGQIMELFKYNVAVDARGESFILSNVSGIKICNVDDTSGIVCLTAKDLNDRISQSQNVNVLPKPSPVWSTGYYSDSEIDAFINQFVEMKKE